MSRQAKGILGTIQLSNVFIDLAITSSNSEKLGTTAQQLRSEYPTATIRDVTSDLSNPETLESSITELLAQLTRDEKKFDHVVWCAGDPVDLTPLEECSLQQIQQGGMTRFFGPILLGKHAKQYMNLTNRSSITFTGGVIHKGPPPGWLFHAAYFAGLEGVTRSLAIDLRPLRINLVSPGPVKAGAWMLWPEEQRKMLMDVVVPRCATGEMGAVDDVAEAYIYLMRNGNSTGTVVETDGGVSIMSA
jgi:NAD(P)-dependent dehydrogenase (short-subunit alcohol dehydrogenase family)